MKTLTLIFTLICLVTDFTFGQSRQIGLIMPIGGDDSEICCIYSPKEGFKVFDSPNGKEIGVLTRTTQSNTGDQAPYKIFFIDNLTKKIAPIDLKNFKEIGYEVMSITYFERKSGFVRVVNLSVDYWLSEKEISNKNFKVIDWQQFFIENSGDLMGFYANDPGLKLKSKPTNESETIKVLKGDLFEITPTKDCNDNWTKVKVKKYKEHPCGTDLSDEKNVEFEIDGWIEIIKDNGQPNLWFYSRGC